MLVNKHQVPKFNVVFIIAIRMILFFGLETSFYYLKLPCTEINGRFNSILVISNLSKVDPCLKWTEYLALQMASSDRFSCIFFVFLFDAKALQEVDIIKFVHVYLL